ncbi:MAG TPA: hypothetical protein VF463_06530 [Sphingobium sp.]
MTSDRLRQFRRAAAPVPGESLRGLVADTCAINRMPNSWGLLQHVGMLHRNRVDIAESLHLDVDCLAAAIRVDRDEVVSRRYPADGPTHRTFNGIKMLKTKIDCRFRRFSPAAIASGNLYHPATHELRDLPFSTIGWDILQDKCPCTEKGVRQGWTRVNGTAWCDSCGGRLGRISPVMVPDQLHASLQLIAKLVDPDPVVQRFAMDMLPRPIQSIDRTLLYDNMMLIARGVDAGRGMPPQSDEVARLALACESLIQWPDGIKSMVASDAAPAGVWHRALRNYAVLDTCASDLGEDPNAPQHHHTSYVPQGTYGLIRTRLLSAKAASRLTGVETNLR